MPNVRVSQRSAIPPFIVMDVMQAAADLEAQGRRVWHLEVGQPCTQAPAGARNAVAKAIEEELLGYSLALGMQPLRERIARHYSDWYGYALDPARVAVTAGASGGVVMACLAAFDPGARVAVPTPGYPCYRNTLVALGLTPVPLRLGPEEDYRPTPEALAALGPIDGLIVASPNNPTGTVLRAAELALLADYCRSEGVRLISDEIYHGLNYLEEQSARPDITAVAHLDEAIVIQSFSKYFSMTGWRVGWMVLPPALVRPVELLSQNLAIATATPSQYAALASFDCYAELDAHKARYRHNRELVLQALRGCGVARLAPADGAFYVYANVEHLTGDSARLCQRALQELGVAITPGLDFDPEEGHKTVRISYARSTEEVGEAMERLAAWLPKYR